jgi:hypothetical protein
MAPAMTALSLDWVLFGSKIATDMPGANDRAVGFSAGRGHRRSDREPFDREQLTGELHDDHPPAASPNFVSRVLIRSFTPLARAAAP